MPSLADAYTSSWKSKSSGAPGTLSKLAPTGPVNNIPPSNPPLPPPAPLDRQHSCQDLEKTVSSEAFDALNTIQVLTMATAGNLMAEEFVKKIDHHLRVIVKACEGDKHWPDKYATHFKEETLKVTTAPTTANITSSSTTAGIPSLGTMAASDGATSVGDLEVDLTEPERLGNFEYEEEDDDDDDAKDVSGNNASKLRISSRLGIGSPALKGRKPGSSSGGKGADGKGSDKSDVDIYNIINAEDKDLKPKKRKGLALGGALSHSITTQLFGDTAGNKSTKHAPATFKYQRTTPVTFDNVTFEFTQYAPQIFLSIREHFGINNQAYIKSMSQLKGGQVGEGKSGMLFFSTADREYIVKTVTRPELRFLERELKSYYDYMVVNGATSLLPRFIGLYFLQLPDKPLMRLIVMNNVFKMPPGRTIELMEMYDLKGSLHTRYVSDEERFTGKVSVLKDLNFCNRHDGTDSHGREMLAVEGPHRMIYLGPIRKIELVANLQSDVEWLRQHNIMDYSLLLAVGFEVTADGLVVPTSIAGDGQASIMASEDGANSASNSNNNNNDCSNSWQSAWGADLGGVRGMNGDFSERAEIYYLGIIDILQEYNMKKKTEHAFKSFTSDSTKISAVDPGFYAERFLNWMESHVA